MEIKRNPPSLGLELPLYLEGTLGFLVLDGSEKFFSIDGQHRVEGIRQAIESQAELGGEENCVILVRGITSAQRAKDPEGFKRTRRLFTTLNRYAKAVSPKDIIALDEDDSVAILTRRLVEEYPLFTGKKISIARSNSIPISDKRSLTSIVALYKVLDFYLANLSPQLWKKFKRFRPTDQEIERLYKQSTSLWDDYCRFFPPLEELRESDPDQQVAEKYRNRDGGHILFRPIGLLMSVKSVRHLMDHEQLSQKQSIQRVSKVPVLLSEYPWVDLLWNAVNRTMITEPPNQKAAEKLLYYCVEVT